MEVEVFTRKEHVEALAGRYLSCGQAGGLGFLDEEEEKEENYIPDTLAAAKYTS